MILKERPVIGRSILGAGTVALAAFAVLLIPTTQLFAQTPAGTRTFTKDVVPILQQKCQVCHQPGGMAPMSLQTYADVRPWVSAIKRRTQAREMPPWDIDRTVGIQKFKNDMSLSDDQIDLIAHWVDAGAPQGNPADMPPPVKWPDATQWQAEKVIGRPPDLVIKSPAFTVLANGNDQWFEPEVPLDLKSPRWMMASETKPTPDSRSITHHANSFKTNPSNPRQSATVSRFVIGKPFDVYPSDVGTPFEPGDKVKFNIHYFSKGSEVKDAHLEVGVWFYPEGYVPKFATNGPEGGTFSSYRETGEFPQVLLIPPHGRQMTQGMHVLQKPARIFEVRAHMHLRGVAQSIEAIYPDGHQEILTRMGWNHRWQLSYEYADDVAPLLPKGTVLIVTSWYDNTSANKLNPDPDQWVVHGRRTGDDMSHMAVGIIYYNNEADFTAAVNERKALQQRTQQQQPPRQEHADATLQKPHD
jgi:mono/diheme cytochrome c family protein